MALNAKNKKSSGGGKDFVEQDIIDEGSYNCRVAQIIELGLQPQRAHKGKEKPPVEFLYITYEITDEFIKDEDGEEILDKPRWQSEDFPFYGVDMDMAKCNKRLKAIDPENKVDGDWAKVCGAPVVVTFVHNSKGDKTYVNVASASVMKKKDVAKLPKLQNPPKVFDLDEPDMEIFEALPKWLQDKIKANLNFKGSPLEEALGGVQEEENEGEEEAEEKKAPPKKKATPKKEVEEKYENDADDGDEPW
jgi:hypothetical protein